MNSSNKLSLDHSKYFKINLELSTQLHFLSGFKDFSIHLTWQLNKMQSMDISSVSETVLAKFHYSQNQIMNNNFWSWCCSRPSWSCCIFGLKIFTLKVKAPLLHSWLMGTFHSMFAAWISSAVFFCRNRNLMLAWSSTLEILHFSLTWFCHWFKVQN